MHLVHLLVDICSPVAWSRNSTWISTTAPRHTGGVMTVRVCWIEELLNRILSSLWRGGEQIDSSIDIIFRKLGWAAVFSRSQPPWVASICSSAGNYQDADDFESFPMQQAFQIIIFSNYDLMKVHYFLPHLLAKSGTRYTSTRRSSCIDHVMI